MSLNLNNLNNCPDLSVRKNISNLSILLTFRHRPKRGIRSKPHCLPHVVRIFSSCKTNGLLDCISMLAHGTQSLLSLGDSVLFGPASLSLL